MTRADKRMNPIHFGSDPADIQIQMNSEIRIQMPDQILALAEFALSEWLLLAIKLLAVFP